MAIPRSSSILRVSSLSDSLHRQGLHRLNKKISRAVSFDKVHIRDYERIVGDNPSVTSGAPISIGWGYSDVAESYSVIEYENSRQGLRRDRSQMIMSREDRWRVLTKEWGVTSREWAAGVRAAGRAKHRRKVTVVNLDKQEIELFFENCIRGSKKFFIKGLRQKRRKAKDTYAKDFMTEAIECQQNGVLDVARRKKYRDLGISVDTIDTVSSQTTRQGEDSWEHDISNKGFDAPLVLAH